ncbi:DinB family protein [Alloacidobacterium dinghuense]|uniref:DinB family protein n=1 Tax=Alloacidobacterium dinghuense TaxID=2763107 RepID=A0A7G8BNB3_9BACT|nr:DinB family protein [Alloacidobacterium dinghuense]QNI34033.1 DinB family protein [Alloacidobacterium dinghuense]
MKRLIALVMLSLSLHAFAQDQSKEKPMTLRGVLLEQLKTTHNVEDWFVPANIAVQGLTPEQVNWKSKPDMHSIGELTYHILFWDKQSLAKFKGETPEKFSGNNDETFTNFDSKKWDATVRELDAVMTEWEKAVESADDKKLAESASTIAHIGTHNAYHIGQIVSIRKEQGSWDPAKGVK